MQEWLYGPGALDFWDCVDRLYDLAEAISYHTRGARSFIAATYRHGTVAMLLVPFRMIPRPPGPIRGVCLADDTLGRIN